MPYTERNRPFQEVRAATWLRAVYSKWQLREVMVDFWHNHFNVSADSDVVAQVGFPAYDRDVIRKHALGNFREFIEAVAKSANITKLAAGEAVDATFEGIAKAIEDRKPSIVVSLRRH